MGLSSAQDESAAESAGWIVDELRRARIELCLTGEITDDDLAILGRSAAYTLAKWPASRALAFNNWMVSYIRHVVAYRSTTQWRRMYKQQCKVGAKTMREFGYQPLGWRDTYAQYKLVRVRAGLSLPAGWAVRYERIYAQQLPWVISPILQNAFQSNTPGGEEALWTNG